MNAKVYDNAMDWHSAWRIDTQAGTKRPICEVCGATNKEVNIYEEHRLVAAHDAGGCGYEQKLDGLERAIKKTYEKCNKHG